MKLLSSLCLALGLILAQPALADMHDHENKDEVKAEAVLGEAAPEFTLMDTDGNTHSLSDFKGKIVVLEWTNHECPYVQKHYATNNMQELQQDATSKGHIWLTINSSAAGNQGHTDAEAAKKVMAEVGSKETARLLDHDGTVGRLYGASVTPHMFVINAEGVLVYNGAIDDTPSALPSDIETATNYVQMALNSLVEGVEVSPAETKPYGCSVKY